MEEPTKNPEPKAQGTEQSAHAVHLTPRAAQKMLAILSDQGTPGYGVRIGVRGGGCTGLSYVIEPCQAPDSRDKVFEVQGVKLFVDPKSFIYVRGMEIDFKPLGTGFTFTNPNAKKACGCGESFSV
jgi:iron-sulfur cluster assembly protein